MPTGCQRLSSVALIILQMYSKVNRNILKFCIYKEERFYSGEKMRKGTAKKCGAFALFIGGVSPQSPRF